MKTTLAVFMALLATPLAAWGQQVHRNGFEGPKPGWTKGGADVAHEETVHAITDQVAHDGQRCELIQLQAKTGKYIYYQYPVGKAPIGAEFSAGVWIKGNRPGMQLLARVVLPNERDPNNLDYRLTTTIPGDVYRAAGRWQRLEIGRPVQLAKQQQQLMQADLKRPLDFTGAYVDMLLLNVYAGPGPTEVFIDDLEIGPLAPDNAFVPANRPKENNNPGKGPQPRPNGRAQLVEYNGRQLLVGGQPFFLRGIRHSDTPLRVLREARFNTLFFDNTAPASLVKEAVDLDFWLAPQLKAFSDDNKPFSPDLVSQELSRFPDNDAVLFWHLGNTFAFEQSVSVSRIAQAIRQADPGRLCTGDVWDGLMPMSRSLNLVGVHRWPLMTTLELPKYREWLDQRRRLANPNTFMWTWIQTHLPDWYTNLLYERSSNAPFAEPVGPQPEQIRLLTYTALASGFRGIGFWSDRFLADSHQGRDRLLGCALLNQEIEMLENLLVTVDNAPEWIDTSSPDVKAAVLRTNKGVLVLPIWQGRGSQFVPGQAAVAKLSITVPQVPQSMQAWEVTPADVRGLKAKRVVGGTEIVLPEFGLTSAIMFTSDTNVVVRFQEQARAKRQLAAQWTYDMALYELEKVKKVQGQLAKQGRAVPDANQLLNDAETRLRSAKDLWDRRVFGEAYHEAQRALRPVRILMRAQWEMTLKGDTTTTKLDSPVSSPYAVTYFTLPRHWEFMEQVGKLIPAANVLPGGDFEIIPQRQLDSWKIEEPTLDDVELQARRVTEIVLPDPAKKPHDAKGAKEKAPPPGPLAKTELPREGKQCAMLEIRPKNKLGAPEALERTLLALTSPPVRLQPGQMVQISGWVRITEKIRSSPDGALFYDNAGGEPLAVRLTEPTPWKKITLYRKVPASGIVQVTLALTGIGAVYFDDVRIEPLVPVGGVIPARAEERQR